MRSLLDRLVNPLHLLIALAAVWLLASSPWLGMYHALPETPGVVNGSHVAIGLVLLPLGLAYFAACTVGGRWRLYFPWLAGNWRGLRDDLGGLAHGRRPGSEGGGLFATIEGLLLVALLATALTGAVWFVARGSEAAVAWRGHHIVAARAFAVLVLAHLVAVSLHLLDLVRD